METVENRHYERAAQVAYDLKTVLIAMSPDQGAMREAAERGDVGEEMEAIMREAHNRGEGSPLFRRFLKAWEDMERALLLAGFLLLFVVPSAYAVDLGSLEELTSNAPSSWTSEPLYGVDRVQSDAYLQERLDLNTYQAERSAELQAPVTYGAPSYQSPTHSYTAYGPNGTALKCTQTARATDCF